MEEKYDSAFVDCYEYYYPELLCYINKRINDMGGSEDMLHDIFANLYSRGEILDRKNPTTKSFLYRVTQNKLIDSYKKKKVVLYSSDIVEGVFVEDFELRKVEDMRVDGEIYIVLFEELKQFSSLEQKIFIRREINGEKICEISKDLNVSYYKINKTIHYIKQRIKKNFEKYRLLDD